MWKAMIKSAGIFLSATIAVGLLLGLMHMFARSVTLDSVRALDLQIIRSAISDRALTDQQDRAVVENVLGNLVAPSGYAFFPLAVPTADGCLENGNRANLCARFPALPSFQEIEKDGAVTEHYGVQILRTREGQYFYFAALGDGSSLLIGQAGHYLAAQRPFHQELMFLREAPLYLTTKRGFNTMWRKSKWTWVFVFIVGVFFWALYALWVTRSERRFRRLTSEARTLDRNLAEKLNELAALRATRDARQEQFERLATAKEDEVAELKADLDAAFELLNETESERNEILRQRDGLEDALVKTRKNRPSANRNVDAEKAHKELFEIRKLWLTDPDWNERYRIEETLAAVDLKRAPFTEFIAFVRMEYYLKRCCDLKGFTDIAENVERINALERGRFLSEKNARLLHQARVARNKWFHAGTPPDRQLIERLLRFLESQSNPEVRPQV